MLLYTSMEIFAINYCTCLKYHTGITFYDSRSILQHSWDELNVYTFVSQNLIIFNSIQELRHLNLGFILSVYFN